MEQWRKDGTKDNKNDNDNHSNKAHAARLIDEWIRLHCIAQQQQTSNESIMAPTESSQLLSPSTTSLIQDEYGNPKLHVDKLPDIKTLIVTGGAILENRGSTARDHLANERSEY